MPSSSSASPPNPSAQPVSAPSTLPQTSPQAAAVPPPLPSVPETTPAEPETTATEATTTSVPTRASTRNRKPVQKLNLHTTITPLTETIPTSVAEALKDPRWRRAMYEELDAQLKNHTWDVVNSSKHFNVVGCKWVFTIKRNRMVPLTGLKLV